MILKPTSDNIVIKVAGEEKEQVTQGGIFIPKAKNQQYRPDMGEVVAVGTGRILNSGEVLKPTVKSGDQIIFNKFAGTEIATEDGMYLIVKENDILAIIE